MSESEGDAGKARILDDLQDAVARMHVVAASGPRVVVASGKRSEGARAMAWQVLFERSLGPDAPTLAWRGSAAVTLPRVLHEGFDTEPTLSDGFAFRRLVDAMREGPVLQAFRADRLPDDVARALVGVLVFEEDGLSLAGIRAIVQEMRAS